MRLLAFLLLVCTLPACAALTVTLSATPPSTGAVGQKIVLIAAVTGAAKPQYRFEVTTTGGTPAYTRDYTTGRSTWWYPTAEGAYTVTARAKDGANGAPASATMSYSVKPKLSAVSLAATVGAVTAVNTRMTFTATATGGGTVEYRPLIGYRAGVSGTITWDQTRPYGLGRSTTFTPDKSGFYFLRIYAREKGRTAYYDVTTPDVKLITRPEVTSFDVTVDPSAGGKVFTAITVTATNAVGGGTLEWKAWAKLKTTSTWTVVRDYAAASVMPWTPLMAGEYDLMVYAREAGKTSVGYDVRKVGLSYTVPATIDPITGAEMIYIPAGEFLMGTPAGATYDYSFSENPERRVYLDGYWIMCDAVTVAQYRAYCAAVGSRMPSFPSGRSWAGKSGWEDVAIQQHPMVGVTWYAAKSYADWAGLALPTEAQREKAARGTDGRTWPWGSTWDATKCANYFNSDSVGMSTWQVGSFPTGNSPYDVRDMAGNILEWCADWYGPYDVAATTNPTGPPLGSYRVRRGGCWQQGSGYLRTAYRHYENPTAGGTVSGFRCVSSPPGR